MAVAQLAECESRWPQIQEVLSGSTFVVAVSLALLRVAASKGQR